MSYRTAGAATMAPTPTVMAPNRSILGQHLSYLYSQSQQTPQQQQQQHPSVLKIQHGASPSMDGPSKGLLNGPGQNNCFLNCAVQVSSSLYTYFFLLHLHYFLHPMRGNFK